MFAIPNTFARRELALDKAEFAVLGIPYDSSESYRSGSRLAPEAIRAASRDLEDYDLEENFDLLSLKICDLGDVEVSFGDFEETKKRAEHDIKKVVEKKKKPIIIGGEHTISYFAASALKKESTDFVFLVFDAHLDYRDDYLGNRFSHACVTRRVAELIGTENVLQLGTRSGSKEELDGAKKDRLQFITALDLSKKPEKAKKAIKEKTNGRNVYVSIDLDVFDPSEAPGVCNPEPGGLRYREFIELLREVKDSNLACFDLVEHAPAYDSTTSVFAAKLILKALSIYKK